MNMVEDLIELHGSTGLLGKGCSINCDGDWVAGVPYEFSMFPERAYRFRDNTQAQAFIDRHPEVFKDRKTYIHVWSVK